MWGLGEARGGRVMPSPPSLADLRAYVSHARNNGFEPRLNPGEAAVVFDALAAAEAERDATKRAFSSYAKALTAVGPHLTPEARRIAEDALRAALGAAPALAERDAAAGEAQRLRAAASEYLAAFQVVEGRRFVSTGQADRVDAARAGLREALSSVPLSGGPPASECRCVLEEHGSLDYGGPAFTGRIDPECPIHAGPAAGVTLTAEQAEQADALLARWPSYTGLASRVRLSEDASEYVDGRALLADTEALRALLRPPAAEGTT